MKKQRFHAFTLIVGSILALTIAFSQFFTRPVASSSKKVKTEHAADQSPDDTQSYISLPSFSLPAPVHVQGNLDSYCLFEILFEKDIEENQNEQACLHPGRFFETLFRVIISPNAP